MTTIGILSDTHSYLPQSIYAHFKNVNEIWHAGDIGDIKVLNELENFKPTKAVFGNIDDAKIKHITSQNLIFNIEDTKILITHIGGYPPKYNAYSKPLIMHHKPNIFICGHSHILKVVKDPKLNLLHLNPGACGNHGWHQVKTVMRLQINADKILKLEVIEL